MSEEASRRRSKYENIEKSERRRSFFEKTPLMTPEKEKADAVLEEWNKRWGEHNLDYVNVLKYPEEYVQKIKEEREMWLKGLDNINKKATTIMEESGEKEDFLIKEDILTTEQKASLMAIDSKISDFFEKSTTFLRDFQVYKRMQEVKLEKIENEIKMIEAMVVAKK